MDYSSEDSFGNESDEIVEVKKVLREAKARKKLLSTKLSAQSEKMSTDREEMQAAYRKQYSEIQRLRQSLHDYDIELRNARFEIGQSVMRETKKNEEIAILQCEHRSVVNELKGQLEQQKSKSEAQFSHVLKEVDKLSKLLSGINKSMSDNSYSLNYKSCQQLLVTAMNDSINLKAFLTGGETKQQSSEAVVVMSSASDNSSSSLNNTLLDMCRGLEEENASLIDSVEHMKRQLAAAQQEVAKNDLIPHYRLAIVRARSYSANLLEQLKREQFTSDSLREQLETTYCDLKRVTEEKKLLYKQLTKSSLQRDESQFNNCNNNFTDFNSGQMASASRLVDPLAGSSSGCVSVDPKVGASSGGSGKAVASQLSSLDREIDELRSKLANSESLKAQITDTLTNNNNSNNNSGSSRGST